MKVLVLTTPRTASTNYCKFLSTLYNLVDCGEPYPYGSGPGTFTKQRLDRANELYFGRKDALLKLHAGAVAEFVPCRPKGWFQDVVNESTDIHFLLRKDIQAQIKSLFVGAYHGIVTGNQEKPIHDLFHIEWQEELIIPDTPVARRQWKMMEMLVHTNLVALSVLYHNLADHNPKVVWYETIADILPGERYNRPVKFEWEPEYMFANDEFWPAQTGKIFDSNQDFL